jgi:hypothetical protein
MQDNFSMHGWRLNQTINETEKIKGTDGKGCWKGYRYAGTENGKDKCVPVSEGEIGQSDILARELYKLQGKISDDLFYKLRKAINSQDPAALAKAKESGDDDFEVGGKKFHVREAKDKKFIQKATKKMEKKGTEGSFTEYCGGEVTKSCIDKAMKSGDPKLIKKANFAKNIKGYKGAEHKSKKSVKESLQLTEDEMIDLIEKIVKEEKSIKGMAETQKVLKKDKKENDDYIASVTKKMKDYLKNMSKGEFTTEPKTFPQGNGQMGKDDTMAYHPSDAVDEYIDAFAYPGQTNLVFDEIKPDEKKIEKYLKGDSTTGNAQVDKDGKALGNVVPSKVGEKFHKNYKDNFYGQEQMKSSYKRYPQDTIEVAGETRKKGGLNYGKKSAQNILDKVDESVTKETKVLNEEFNKMKHLMGYNKNTQ